LAPTRPKTWPGLVTGNLPSAKSSVIPAVESIRMTAFDPRKVPEQFEVVWLVAMGEIFVQIFREVDYLYGRVSLEQGSDSTSAREDYSICSV
jgi:hypothetical protein